MGVFRFRCLLLFLQLLRSLAQLLDFGLDKPSDYLPAGCDTSMVKEKVGSSTLRAAPATLSRAFPAPGAVQGPAVDCLRSPTASILVIKHPTCFSAASPRFGAPAPPSACSGSEHQPHRNRNRAMPCVQLKRILQIHGQPENREA